MSKIEVNTVDVQCGSSLTLGSSGKTVTLATGATQSGFGRTGTVDWCTTAKTSPFTGVSGKGYFVNTTSGSVTVTLPASPSAGDIIAIKDYANTFDTNSVSIGRNGSKINGVCSCSTLVTESQSVTLIYVDATKGWQDIHDSTSNVQGTTYMSASGGAATVTCGNFKTHIFTGDANFVVSSISNTASFNKVEYLVIGGGAHGGGGACSSGYAAGGGGGGGFRIYSTAPGSNSPLNAPEGTPVTATTYPVTVGAGGTNPGPGGSNSVFSIITSAGGGTGATSNAPTPSEPAPSRANGVDGGSGGGGGSSGPIPSGSAGAGNTPPVSPPQGNPGGTGTSANNTAGGGGGGAGAAGANAAPGSAGGNGGNGSYIADPFIGPTAPSYGTPGPVSSTRYFSGGGGGASGHVPNNAGTSAGTGGAGGGTAGVTSGITTNAAANTGGAGGGSSGANNPGSPPPHATGGSGIGLIRYWYQ